MTTRWTTHPLPAAPGIVLLDGMGDTAVMHARVYPAGKGVGLAEDTYQALVWHAEGRADCSVRGVERAKEWAERTLLEFGMHMDRPTIGQLKGQIAARKAERGV